MPLPPETQFGRYRIRSQIGAGGMGEVYLAEDTSELERKVAVKILLRELALDRERMQRFIQEAKTISALNHPNILTIHEIGEAEGTRFIVTEYVDGETLRNHMRAKRVKLQEVLDIAIQIASALDAAHEARVIHRDIKPENVMIRRRDQIVKVLDFGLAKLAATAEEEHAPQAIDTEAGTKMMVNTEPGVLMGTVGYMSPEQSQGSRQLDHRTDIWSLGVLLFEMITGRLPFEGRDIHRQVIAIQEQDPPPLSRYAEGVPARLEEIVEKALAKSPDERYQTARDFLIDLRNLKRRLEVDAEIERSVSPELRCAATDAKESASSPQPATGAQPVTPTVEQEAHSTSSAEYLVTEIKRHRLAALVTLLLIVSASIGLILYFRARSSNSDAIDSIAVLPFVNQNNDPEMEYRSDGLTESIINSLTQLPNLKVIARSSVFRYKGKETDPVAVGKELGVRAVLTGRVMQRGDNLTVSVELVDVLGNKQLWGEQYERKASNLLSVQREIAKDISSNLRLKLTGADEGRVAKNYTENSEAYQAYLKGRFYLNKSTEDGVRRALEYFNQAVAIDPNYAQAYAGLADTYWGMSDWLLAPTEAIPKAKAAATKAVELDNSLSEAHASLGEVLLRFDYDWMEAEKELKKATELNPRDALAHIAYSDYLLAAQRFDESLREAKAALDIDPLSPSYNLSPAFIYQYTHQDEKALEQLRRIIELDPNFAPAHSNLSFVYLHMGRLDDAVAEIERAAQLDDSQFMLSNLAYLYAVSGRRAEAQKQLDKLLELSRQRYVSPYAIVFPYVGLGDKEQALYWLNKAYETRSDSLIYLKVHWTLDPLRSDARFADIVRKVGIP